MRPPPVLVGLLLVCGSITLAAQEPAALPVVAVLRPIADAAVPGAEAVSASIHRTLSLTIDYLGDYRLVEVETTTAARADIDAFRTACREHGLDNLLFGTVRRGQEGEIRISLGVYDRLQDEITIEQTGSVTSLLDIFAVADNLAAELIEGFSGVHVEYGALSLAFERRPYDVAVLVDGRSAGVNAVLIEQLVAGEHELVLSGVEGPVVYRETVVVAPGAATEIRIRLPPIDEETAARLGEIERRLAGYSTIDTDDAGHLRSQALDEARDLLRRSEHPGSSTLLVEYDDRRLRADEAGQTEPFPLAPALEALVHRETADVATGDAIRALEASLSSLVRHLNSATYARFTISGTMSGRDVRVDTDHATVELLPEIGERHLVRIRATSTHPESRDMGVFIQLHMDGIDREGRYEIEAVGCGSPIRALVGGEPITGDHAGSGACIQAGYLVITQTYGRVAGRFDWTTERAERYQGAFDVPLEHRRSLSTLTLPVTLDGDASEWIGLDPAYTIVADRVGEARDGPSRDVAGLQLATTGSDLSIYYHLGGSPEENDQVYYQLNFGPENRARDIILRYVDDTWRYFVRAEGVPGSGYFTRVIAEGVSVRAGARGLEARVPLREIGLELGDVLRINAHIDAGGTTDSTHYVQMRW